MEAVKGPGTLGQPDRCIYCFASDVPLQDEHIVPLALNGQWLLRNASCTRCAAITSAFERSVCRDSLLKERAALGLRTRRPSNRPKTFPILIEVDGEKREIAVPAKDHHVPIILPLFAPPAFLSKRPYQSGISLDGISIADKAIGRTIEYVDHKYAKGKWGFRLKYEPVAFARMIAKIGYGFAVGEVGLDGIEESYVLPAILGERNDIGRWVGCDEGEQELLPGSAGLHEVGLFLKRRALHAIVKPFAQFEAQEYRVVVGRVSDRAVAKLRTT